MGGYTAIVICMVYSICLIGLSWTDKPCHTSVLYECAKGETCQATDNKSNNTNGVCKCKTGFQRKVSDGPCIPNPSSDVTPRSPDASSQPPSSEVSNASSLSVSAIAACVIVPLLVLGAIGLVLAARRYQWLQKLHRLRVRRYDEVRIGQDDDDDDDPPLA